MCNREPRFFVNYRRDVHSSNGAFRCLGAYISSICFCVPPPSIFFPPIRALRDSSVVRKVLNGWKERVLLTRSESSARPTAAILFRLTKCTPISLRVHATTIVSRAFCVGNARARATCPPPSDESRWTCFPSPRRNLDRQSAERSRTRFWRRVSCSVQMVVIRAHVSTVRTGSMVSRALRWSIRPETEINRFGTNTNWDSDNSSEQLVGQAGENLPGQEPLKNKRIIKT